MKRSGFTLIEIMIVVGIIAIMLASAVMSVASGRGAVRIKEATRGVVQLSRYASALALLRQRPVVVTFLHSGKVEVRISGDATDPGDIGKPSDPIYREVDGKATLTASEYAAEDDDEEATSANSKRKGAPAKDAGSGGNAQVSDEKKGYFYSRRVLDPDILAKEDADGEYEGVTFTVEVLGEDGEPLDPAVAASLSLPRPKRKAKSNASLFIDGVRIGDDGEAKEEEDESGTNPPVSVTYETNGNVNPHRIIVRLEGESESDEGFAINISRSGKATVGDDEETGGRRVRRRRR